MPTSLEVRQAMLSVCPKTLFPGTIIYELGSGWGGLSFELGRRYPQHQVIGLEISILPWAFSILRCFAGKHPNVKFRLGNIHRAEFENAGLLVCYLMPGAMARLAKNLPDKLARGTRGGTWIVSNTFALPGFEPEADLIAGDRHRSHVYAYRI